MELPDRSQARSWEGRDVVDSDGQRLGRCVGVFADTATGQPEWLHIDVEGHVRSFVPAIDAAESDGTVRVRFSRDAVLGAPSVGDDDQLSKAEEIELYRHYGVPVASGEGSVLPSDDASVGTGDSATSTSTSTMATAAGTAAAAGGVAPVAGTSDRTSTAASASSGADTSVAETDAVDGPRDRTDDTTGLRPATSGAVDDDSSALADAAPVSGAAVTPVTGEQLPVLDPAAASTPVIEEQVTYVDEQEDVVDEAADVAPAAAEQPRPALRRVPPASPPPPPPAAPSSSGGGIAALAPLGAVAGLAAAVALALRARDRRARRRATPAARVGRLGSALRAGSLAARTSATNTLAGVSDAAELTRRSAATAASKAAQAAAEQQAASKRRRSRSQTSSVLAAASKTAASQKRAASRAAAAQRTAARASVAAAATAAAKQREAASSSLAAASKTAGQQRRAARKAARKALASASKTAAKQRAAAASLTTASSTAAKRRTKSASLRAPSLRRPSAADSVAAVPAKVAKRGRKVRRSIGRTLWNLVLLSAGGGGYVLGAKAGRQRYDELTQVASAVAESPQVQSVTEAVTDPERRADLLAEVQQQASSLVGRRGEPRA